MEGVPFSFQPVQVPVGGNDVTVPDDVKLESSEGRCKVIEIAGCDTVTIQAGEIIFTQCHGTRNSSEM